jgi:ribonuclease Z
MKLTITGHSTAFFSTWYLIEELGILFDAGDGVVSNLLNKVHKINHVFVSHAHRDHLSGLQQTVQMGALVNAPTVYFPKDSESFVHLGNFASQFDAHAALVKWQPLGEGEQVMLREDLLVQAHRNEHVVAPADITRSLGFKVIQRRRKLKPEFAHLAQNDLRDLILEKGRDHTTEWVHKTLLGFSGDTPIGDLGLWSGTEVLIHECTFLGGLEDEGLEKKPYHEHSTLPEVLEMACTSAPEKLILGHFSSRYSGELIRERVTVLCTERKVPCPVWLMLPGVVEHDVLGREPDYRP